MRTVKSARPVLGSFDQKFSPRDWLRDHGSGIVNSTFLPADLVRVAVSSPNGMRVDPGLWINRCSLVGDVDQRIALMLGHAEQGVVTDPTVRTAEYALKVTPRSPNDKVDPGEKVWLGEETRVELVAGDVKMCKFAGYGVPDIGHIGGHVERYIGFDRQVWWAVQSVIWARDRWDRGERTAKLDYNGGEIVECADLDAAWLIWYTPGESVLIDRPWIMWNVIRGIA